MDLDLAGVARLGSSAGSVLGSHRDRRRDGRAGGEPPPGLGGTPMRDNGPPKLSRHRRSSRRSAAGRHRCPGPIGRGRGRSDPGRPAPRPLPGEDGPHPADRAPAPARDTDEVLRPGHHAQRGLLRPLPRLPRPDECGSGDVAAQGPRARGPAPRAQHGGSQDQVPARPGRGGEPVLGQQPRPVRAARAGRRVGRRRHGQCRVGRARACGTSWPWPASGKAPCR